MKSEILTVHEVEAIVKEDWLTLKGRRRHEEFGFVPAKSFDQLTPAFMMTWLRVKFEARTTRFLEEEGIKTPEKIIDLYKNLVAARKNGGQEV